MLESTHQHVEIAIVGAGFSGLGAAIALKQDGEDDFVVLERAGELGGTWRDNSYPGCACDIPSVLYSWTAEQNPRWTRAFAGQPEILDYMREVVERHRLASHLRFGHEVRRLAWNAELRHWEIETKRRRPDGRRGDLGRRRACRSGDSSAAQARELRGDGFSLRPLEPRPRPRRS